MSKFKQMILKDIEKCKELIDKDFASESDVLELVGKYKIDYPNFSDGLINYAHIPGTEANEINNIKIVKSKLEYLIGRASNPDVLNKNHPALPTINISNKNENSNIINIKMSITDIKENIEENTFLNELEKQELIKLLYEIESLQKSKETRPKKWEKAKKIFSYILDKGVDIAVMYIPQILEAISK